MIKEELKQFDSKVSDGRIIIYTKEYNDLIGDVVPTEHHISLERAKEIYLELQKIINGFSTLLQPVGDGWISVEDEKPPFIEGNGYSENVWTWCDGKRMIMTYARLKDDNNEWFCAWCNCYGNIDGDGDFDDNYNPTHWQPLPAPPKQ